MSTPATRVAVFDLDGTLTRRDTLVPFLLGWLRTRPQRWWRLWRLPFTLARYALRISNRGQLKASLVRQAMAGAHRDEIEAWSEAFADHVVRHELRADAVNAVRRHRDAGDHLVLLSASVDLYVPKIGARLGFHETVCTGLSWQGDRLTALLTSENRRGEEKQRCVEELKALYPLARFAAYGNAACDLDHLRIVDEPLLVNAPPAARAQAARLGIRCDDWP